MFVACNTLCFAQEPMETALRQIVELEFDKFELALVEGGQHLRLSEAGDDPDAALAQIRRGPSLVPSVCYLDFGAADWSDPVTVKRFEGLCRLAKSLSRRRDHDARRAARHVDRRRSQTAHARWAPMPSAKAWCWPCSRTPRP